jgi:hypothetical protein
LKNKQLTCFQYRNWFNSVPGHHRPDRSLRIPLKSNLSFIQLSLSSSHLFTMLIFWDAIKSNTARACFGSVAPQLPGRTPASVTKVSLKMRDCDFNHRRPQP